MKLPLMAALAALSLYGCAGQSANTREASSPEAGAMGGSGSAGAASEASSSEGISSDAAASDESPGETGNVSDLEKRDRMDAPTVYDGEATGGSGAADEAVKTKDGQKWDVQQNTPTDLGDAQAPAGSVNQNKDSDGTGGSGAGDDSSAGKSEIKDESGALNSDTDDSSTDSKVDTDATPDPTN
ncbi:hypothetical protein [Corallococcus llansteffanensis]|uniref:Lipoprotein n=1 Tax=Corallococcus llansteffanensis TaxID=2316731 RepID=A0A3A8NRC1_9BACT|nr:hypothetical protein [Corallococcus llansteffanensis]RKH44721.1 hypothetical protein D7V93_35975 [Corallococcus llansteffanensis]